MDKLSDGKGCGSESADGDHADAFPLVVPDYAVGFWVFDDLAIDIEHVFMVAVGELDNDIPAAIDTFFHGIGIGVPIIEVTDDGDF